MNKKLKYLWKYFYFLIIIVIYSFLFPNTISSHDKFEHLSIENGLSQNTVHSIIQDSKGFMWFATEEGLNKHDGYTCIIYRNRRTDTNTLSDNFLWTLFEDSDNTIWIGTNNGGLNSFNEEDETFTRYQYNSENPKSISNNSVRAIFEDSKGTLWIGTEGGGLNKFNPTDNSFKKYLNKHGVPTSLSNNNIRTIIEDEPGFLLIGTNGGGVNRFDIKNEIFSSLSNEKEILECSSVSSLTKDKDGNIWIGTNGSGVIKYKNGKYNFLEYDFSDPNSLVNNYVTSSIEDSNGNIWICTEGGLCKFDMENNYFIRYTNEPYNSSTISNNLIRTVFEDNTGIIWIGTVGGGISKLQIQYKKIQLFKKNPSKKNSLSSNMIRSIFEDKSGILWIGTLDGGLNIYQRDKNKFTHLNYEQDNNSSLSSDNVISIFEDRSGNIWIGTWGGGLNKILKKSIPRLLEGKTFKIFNYSKNDMEENSLTNNIVQAINEDQLGNLWIGTENGLDFFNRKNNSFIHFKHNPNNENSISDNRVQSNCILEDRDGNLWVGTWNGLNMLSKEEKEKVNTAEEPKFIQFKSENNNLKSLSDDRIISIHEDPNGQIWVGTHGGGFNKVVRNNGTNIFKYEFINYTDINGLASNIVYGIQSDIHDNLWISTNNGISKFNTKSEVFRNYYESDGLQSNQFFYGACASGKDGRLYFGGINGLNSFYPNELRDNPHIPPIYITDFQLFNEKIKPSAYSSNIDKQLSYVKSIELPYDEYFLSFEFVALDYTNPEQNSYTYMLKGYDKDWIKSGNRRFATYNYLTNGEYTFIVKGSNNDGVWNELGTSLNIIIYPPFWKSWWFVLLSLFSIAGLISYLVIYRIKQLLAVERLRIKLAADLHDNIGSGLTEISILSEVIFNRLQNESGDIQKSLKQISQSSRELIDEMSDIVWLVNPRRDSLYDLILRLEDNYSEIFSHTEISFTSHNLRYLEKITLSMEHRQHLYLIFKEGINNAITHGKCTELVLNANVNHNVLTMVLHDNGEGFEIADKRKGNGLNNMKSRAQKIKGELIINSKIGKGTELQFIGKIV